MTSVVNATGNQDIDGVLWGWKWDFTDISFSFPTSTAEYNFYAEIDGFQAFESTAGDDKQGAVRTILANVESFCNLTFTETTGVGAILRYAEATSIDYTDNSNVAGHHGLHDIGTAEANPPELGYNGNPPFSPLYSQGDSWFNPNNYDNPRIGTFQYTAGIMHETGHNLGLKHGHVTQDGHGTTFPTLPDDHDSYEYSVMTYSQFPGDQPGAPGNFDNAPNHPTTYMQDDIAALQYMYGANYSYHNDNTTYTWSPTTGQEFINGVGQSTPFANFILMTVWDGGGNDTYDFSNYTTDLKVDLSPGGWTILDTSISHLQRADLGNDQAGGAEYFARGNIANALVDPNNPSETASLIDNAIGGSGNDQIYGNNIDNDLKGGGGSDTLYGFDGSDNLFGNDGNDSLKGGGGADVLSGDNGDDTLKGGGGADFLFGGAGTDTADYSDSDASVAVNLQSGSGAGGYANGDSLDSIENVKGSQYQDLIFGGDATANTLAGGDGNDLLFGGGGNDTLLGENDADNLSGQAGNDSLDGGAGADFMDGGTGDDSYYVDNAGDTVGENVNEGIDTVFTTVNYALSANVENLTYTGPTNTGFVGFGNAINNTILGANGDDRLTGADGADTLQGFAGNDILDGGYGADIMTGGAGNDSYYVDNVGDVVIEAANEGVDWIGCYLFSYTLGANVENLVYVNVIGNFTGIGNSLANAITGGSGDDYLDGNIGADILRGDFGDDTFIVDNPGDTVFENLNEGTDAVVTSLTSYTLGTNIESLMYSGGAVFTGAGNGLDNVIFGSTANDILSGMGGNDSLQGGLGADTMAGGTGNDSYFVDNAGDVVTENANEGTDTVYVAFNYLLQNNVENLVLQGAADLQGYGNALANTLTGNTGNNLLDGGTGADAMLGGAGNDIYFADNIADGVIENANEGTDTVFATVNFALTPNVENLIMQGVANLQGYGNALANALYGNTGDNLLDGGTGADLMVGGAGNDVYFADNIGDSAFESAGQGNDTVFSTANFGLAADVENLVLQGAADLQGYGNAQANTLYGNSGNNLLNGFGGADLMVGGAGNDNYFVDNIGDAAFESAGQGNDTVFSTANFALAADVENLILQGSADLQGYGNAQANTIYGNAGNNLLNGGGGADLMAGGAGDDVYFVDNVGDGILENANEGNDAVFASASYALSANVEGLVLQGAGNIDGIGNALANSLYGNTGNNTLDGSGGADQLTGNAGNDVFVFRPGQANGDVVVDFAGNGASAGDSLAFIGYGAGATFTNIDATHWQVNYGGGASHDVIVFLNGALIDNTDYLFS